MSRFATFAAAAAALVGVVLGVGAVSVSSASTQAAWSDRSHASAAVTAGSWSTPSAIGCTAMNANGTVMAGGRCTVTSVAVDAEWGTAPSRTRGYRVVFDTNAGSGYVQFTIDLSATTYRSSFAWTNAGIVSNGPVTPTNGWTCASLPTLTAKTPTNWGWTTGSSIYFQVLENKSSGGVTCS